MSTQPPRPFTHQQVSDRITAYLHGQLLPAERDLFIDHIDTCDRCHIELQEAQALAADLRAEGFALRPQLSADASQRIQQKLYRTMRRAIWMQRLSVSIRTIGAVALVGTSLIIVGLLGSQWLNFLADTNEPIPGSSIPPQAEITTAVPSNPAIIPAAPQERPLPAPIYDDSPPQTNAPRTSLYRPNLASITPGQTPDTIAAKIMETAVSRDYATLSTLFVALNTTHDPVMRLWRIYGDRCNGAIDTTTIRYEIYPKFNTSFVRVDLYDNNSYLGEIKMRRFNDDWFPTFASGPSIMGCISR